MRLFFAIDLPESLHEPVAGIQSDLADAAGLSVTDPAQAHLTMKFLGETPTAAAADGDEPSVDDAKLAGAAAVDAAGLDPFEVEVRGLGAFPSTEYISVVWAGVDDGAAALRDLAGALEAATTDRGFAEADNEFTPHVTLARMNDARGKGLVQDRLRNADPTVGRFTAEELRLTRSILREDGAEHETVARFPL